MDADAFDRYDAERFGVLVGQVYAMCGNAAEASDAVHFAGAAVPISTLPRTIQASC